MATLVFTSDQRDAILTDYVNKHHAEGLEELFNTPIDNLYNDNDELTLSDTQVEQVIAEYARIHHFDGLVELLGTDTFLKEETPDEYDPLATVNTQPRFHQLRMSLGLTQQEAANLLGVTRSTICKWEKSVSDTHPSAIALNTLETMRRDQLEEVNNTVQRIEETGGRATISQYTDERLYRKAGHAGRVSVYNATQRMIADRLEAGGYPVEVTYNEG